jgi:hypothetical protein
MSELPKALTPAATLDEMRADAARVVTYWVNHPKCTDPCTVENVTAYIDSLIVNAWRKGMLEQLTDPNS